MISPPQADGPRAPRSKVVIPHRLKWHGELAACAIWLFGRSVSSTWRLNIINQTGLPQNHKGPLIAAIWHNRLAVAMPIWKWWTKNIPGENLAALISASRDGAMLARTLSYFGVRAIRGSSSRRGGQALVELVSSLRDGWTVAITPDGPRGPKSQVQPGIILLAQLSGTPIVPVGVHIQKKKELKSWDSFQIPLPFTRCEATLGRPLLVPRDASPEEREQLRAELEATLLSLNRD